jgi:hypothetical protein
MGDVVYRACISDRVFHMSKKQFKINILTPSWCHNGVSSWSSVFFPLDGERCSTRCRVPVTRNNLIICGPAIRWVFHCTIESTHKKLIEYIYRDVHTTTRMQYKLQSLISNTYIDKCHVTVTLDLTLSLQRYLQLNVTPVFTVRCSLERDSR